MRFQLFLNDGKDNCLKSLSKLFQMLTALWRKRRWPDFVLLGGISRDVITGDPDVECVNMVK